MPDPAQGGSNFREKIIQVKDLRRWFEFAQVAASEPDCIKVMPIESPGSSLTAMEMVADWVGEVIGLKPGVLSQIQIEKK